MVSSDPYTPGDSYYECQACGHRSTADHTPASCPKCGGYVKNIGVAQE